MQKRMMRGGLLFLVFSIILTTTAFAAEFRASERFTRYSAKLSTGNDNNLYVFFTVATSSTMDTLGASSIAVQRYDDSRWVTECTLTVKDTPAMQTSNTSQYSASIPYEPNYSNGTYRAVVTFYAKDSAGSNTAQITTK